MGFLDFASKRKQVNKPQQQPLGYWEEQSYMIAIPKDESVNFEDNILEKIASVEGLTIKQKKNFSADQKIFGSAVIDYKGEEYKISFYYDDFDAQLQLPPINMQTLSQKEIHSLKNAKMAFTLHMEFNDDAIKSYHLQLKLMLAVMPELAVIFDESAESVISGRQVKLYAQSDVVPPIAALYSIQAVGEKNGEVWLHTHGLCRCGVTELEIVKSCSEYVNEHAQIITSLAGRLLQKDNKDNFYYIGRIEDDIPIVVTYVPWTKALDEYNDLALGGYEDRKDGHNSRTSLIFAYKNERDEKLCNYSKIDIYDNLWENGNPMFFISNQETERMKAVAEERFDYIKKAWEMLDCDVLIKIGLKIDEKYSEEAGNTNREHIWFQLVEMKEKSFTARLTQEAYWVDDIHEGDIREFTVDDVTDWRIYTDEFVVSPDTVYVLFDD